MARPIPRPPKLDEDRCLARVLKFCLCLSNQKSVSPKTLERAFAEFKDAFPEMIRNEGKRDELVVLCRNIFAKRDDIMAVDIQKDYLELQGFTYNESTFDDLYLNQWRGLQQQGESSESSDDEAEESKEESKAGQWGDEHDAIMGASTSGPAVEEEKANHFEEDAEEETRAEPAEEVDLT